MDRLLHNRLWRPTVLASALLLFGATVFVAQSWLATPAPLTNEEKAAVEAAVNKIRPDFDMANFRRGRDGAVRVFVSDGYLGGETIAVEKSDGQWVARVETVFF